MSTSETRVTVDSGNASTTTTITAEEKREKVLDGRINTVMHGTLTIVFMALMGAAMLMRITDFKTFVVCGMVVGGWVPLHYIVQGMAVFYGAKLPGAPKGPTMPPPMSVLLSVLGLKYAGAAVSAGAMRAATIGLASIVGTGVGVQACSGYLDAHRANLGSAIQNIDIPLIQAAVSAARTFGGIALSGDANGQRQLDEVLGHVERGAGLAGSVVGVVGVATSPNAANTVSALRDLKAFLEGFGVRIGQRPNPQAETARTEALLRVRRALGE